ncbi:glutathione S-transferase family protein, partial [Salmonella sp. s51944]|uniref:glutathione S-transferase family protein n=2 Tax=unclassified Salmonella TaxID=2614656 RepID=UPI0039811F4A
EEWGKIKPTTTLGQLPILYVDGKEVPQSRAINRLVARDLGLYGSNTWEQALIDVVCETVDEVWPAVAGIFMEKDEAKKDELRKKFATEDLVKLAEKLGKLLKQNKNGEGWFVGDKISLADVAVYTAVAEFFPALAKCGEVDLTGQDALKGLLSRVKSNEKVAEWIKNRPQTDM